MQSTVVEIGEPKPMEQKEPDSVPLRRSQRTRRPPERYRNNFVKSDRTKIHSLSQMRQATRIAMQIDWNETSRCMLSHHFVDLLDQATCDLSFELFELHPLHFHVKLQASNLDDPSFKEVMNGDPNELKYWYDAIDAELLALYEKLCFEVVSKKEAKGQQIVNSTWAFKCKPRPDGSLLKYKACLCMHGDQMYEGLNEGKDVKSTSGYAPVIDWGTI